jgi:polyphosphate glucokinase
MVLPFFSRSPSRMEILGVDVGGSGIKGALVDIASGAMTSDRHRIPTPQPSKPKAVARAVAEVTRYFDWQGPVGCGFPAALRQGVPLTAANIHKKWLDTNAATLLAEATGCPVRMINDADAAGLAEMTFGAGRGHGGLVLVVTIGTGLGTALFTDGVLVPNCELGHIEIRGKEAEHRASDAIRKAEDLSWKQWAGRFDEFLCALEHLIWPDLIILGGGASKRYDRFVPYLTVRAEVVPAQMRNEAGIIGAALAAKPLISVS